MKYHGSIGFAQDVETAPGVHEEHIVEHDYYGNVLRASRSLVQSQLSPGYEVQISNQISIIADAFAELNMFAIRYAKWQGTRWRVTNIEAQRPRLILTLGGVYNAGDEG